MFRRWIPWKFIIRRAAKAYGFTDPISILARIRRFAQPSEVQEPIELLRAGIVFHARGLINSKAIQQNLDWVWPYWVEKQFNPADSSFIPRAFSVSHVNLTHRNWTAIGNPGLDVYPLVDPRGLVTPFFDGWSIDFWIVSSNGDKLLPSKQENAEQFQKMDNNLEVMTIASNASHRLSTRVAMEHPGSKPELRIDCQATSSKQGWLVVSIRPYNPEGIQFIEKLKKSSSPPGIRVNGKTQIYFSQQPSKAIFSDYSEGDVIHKLMDQEDRTGVNCKVGMATGAILFPLNEKQGTTETQLRIPLQDRIKKFSSRSASVPMDWDLMVKKSAGLEIPDSDIQNLYQAAVRTLILLSSGEIVPGPYTYKRFWFRDACLMLNALLVLGLEERSERLLQSFPQKQKSSGYFQSQQGEWDSNGQVLWVLDRFQQLSDQNLSTGWIEVVEKGAQWIEKKRVFSDRKKRHFGLLPAGFSAEHLGPNDYYYWDNFWGIVGLQAASRIMERFAKTSQMEHFFQESLDFKKRVLESIANIPDKRKKGGLPASPYRRMDAGAIGSLVADYPLQLYPAHDPEIMNTVEYLLTNCFFEGGFFQDMIHSGINPYLTLCIAQTLLRNEDQRYKDLIKTVASLATSTGQWPEAIHPITKGGCMGDGQHGWAAAEWVMMIRHLFVREEQDRLILGSGLFAEWIQEEKSISFGPTLTPFGSIQLSFKLVEENLQLDIDFQKKEPNCNLEVRVPGFEKKEIIDTSKTIYLRPE